MPNPVVHFGIGCIGCIDSEGNFIGLYSLR